MEGCTCGRENRLHLIILSEDLAKCYGHVLVRKLLK